MDANEDKTPINQGDPATEPIDLAQAFKMYNQANRTAVEQPVDNEPTVEPVVDSGGLGSEQPDQATVQGEDTAAVGELGGNGASIDGSADVVEPVDYNPARESILRDVQQEALRTTRQKFAEQQIEMWSIEDLYERDENTGRVRFRNPDDPSRDFQSRYEAQQFVDAMNKQITQSFRAEVNKAQREIIQREAPKLRLIEFAPKYDVMDQVTKDIFEDMIEPYAVKDNGGKIIGFNVNLDAVHAQASKIAQRVKQYVPQQPQQQEEPETKPAAKSPALDAKTGASLSADYEPKTIGEALKMYDSNKRKEKNNGK